MGQPVSPVKQPGHAAQHRRRRVIRVQGQTDTLGLGHRQHGVDEIGVVGPHLVFGDHRAIAAIDWHRKRMAKGRGHEVTQRLGVVGRINRRLIELGRTSPTPRWGQPFGAPDRVGHEVISKDRHASTPDGLDGGAVILDLFIAARKAQHRLVIEMRRHVLDGFKFQSAGLDLFNQRPNVALLPARLARQGRVVHLDATCADLGGKAQFLIRQVMKLPDRHPDTHDHPADFQQIAPEVRALQAWP